MCVETSILVGTCVLNLGIAAWAVLADDTRHVGQGDEASRISQMMQHHLARDG